MSTRRGRHVWIVGWVFVISLSAAWAPAQSPTGESLSGVAVLDEWGNRITSLGVAVRENALRTQVRTTMAQLAMFDAVNAVLDGNFKPFASKPAATPGASPEAAAIGAAYIVALYEFPSQAGNIDAAYADSIARLSVSPEEIEAGVAIGEAAANAVLAKRDGDNRNLPDLTGYTPAGGPGVWVPTPPAFTAPQTPFLQFVTPFGYDDPARFRPIAPPALERGKYLADYVEIKDYGASDSPSRTADQSATALFWSGSASALWTANVRSLAASMDILTGARFEALGIAAITNALIATWDSKFHYMFWRPVTAIRAGDTDGNPYTEADPLWTPFIVTPSHPEYIAAHSAVGASTTGFYAVWFGTDHFPLDFKGTGGAVRHYESVEEIHAEESNARVWGGMHWRHSTEVGTRIGTRVGHYAATHLLKPL
jgi:PAP2 superfamily